MARPISFPFAGTVALLVGTIFIAGLAERRTPEPLAVPLDRISPQISGWTTLKDQTLDPHILKSLDPTAYLSRAYQKAGSHLDVFIAFYAQQRAGESMHSPKHCLPGSGWEIWKHDSALVPVNGKMFEINKYSIQNLGTRMLMFYWYQSNSRIVSSEFVGKMLLARDTVLTGHTAGSIVRIMVPDAPGADKEAIAFASALIPEVQRCFGH